MVSIRYKVFAQDFRGISLLRLSSPAYAGILLQGPRDQEHRLRKAFAAALRLHPEFPEQILKPVSFNADPKAATCSALFEYRSFSLLTDYLRHAPGSGQYAAGRRCGFFLREVHALPVRGRHKAGQLSPWAQQARRSLEAYFASPYRFAGDRLTLNSLQQRLNFLFGLRPVYSVGSVSASAFLLSAQGGVLLHPLLALQKAPAARDFAPLCACDGESYPCFAAGLVDGYCGNQDKSRFWAMLAVYCAYYATAGLAARLERAQRGAGGSGKLSLKELEFRIRAAERQSLQLREDFADFTYPVPLWYQSAQVTKARNEARALRLL